MPYHYDILTFFSQLLISKKDPRLIKEMTLHKDNPRHRLQATNKLCSNIKECKGDDDDTGVEDAVRAPKP